MALNRRGFFGTIAAALVAGPLAKLWPAPKPAGVALRFVQQYTVVESYGLNRIDVLYGVARINPPLFADVHVLGPDPDDAPVATDMLDDGWTPEPCRLEVGDILTIGGGA